MQALISWRGWLLGRHRMQAARSGRMLRRCKRTKFYAILEVAYMAPEEAGVRLWRLSSDSRVFLRAL